MGRSSGSLKQFDRTREETDLGGVRVVVIWRNGEEELGPFHLARIFSSASSTNGEEGGGERRARAGRYKATGDQTWDDVPLAGDEWNCQP